MAEQFFGITDTGRVRDNNEDAFIAQSSDGLIIACVIDGVGGYEGGEVAAAIAKESVLSTFKQKPVDINGAMRNAFAEANEKIYTGKLEGGKNNSMACVLTLAVTDVRNNKFYYAHVGDTRLYLFRDQSLIKITKDQSFVGFLEDSGRLSEAEAMSHPKRNEINKALGFDPTANLAADYMETGESPFLPGDAILLCSDGLTDMITASQITSILLKKTTLDQKCRELIAAANNAGGKDNITAVLVLNNKKPAKPELKKPVLVKKQQAQVKEPIKPAPKQQPLPPPVSKKKGNNGGVIILLGILCLVFLGGFIWQWWKHNKTSPSITPAERKERNAEEIRLQTFINTAASDTIRLDATSLGTNITLTDTLWIRRDTLYLTGSSSTVIRKDEDFGDGPAIVITPQCRYVEIDSISLQGFQVGILASNHTVLQLKNVQFKNCSTAVAYKVQPDSLFITNLFKRSNTGSDNSIEKTANSNQ